MHKKFFNTQQRSLQKLFILEKNRLLRNWFYTVKNINNKKVNNVKKLKYFCSNVPSNSLNDLKILFDGYNHSNAHTYEIELDSSIYISHNKKSLLDPREKWFVNNSNSHIPNEVIGLLQLGEGFCLPPNDIKHGK